MKEQYLNSVRALLDCPGRERERLLARLDHAVTAYLEDAPDADEAGLAAALGTPEECAAHLMEECAPEAVAAARRKKNRRHRAVTAVLGVLLAVMVGVSAYLWSNGGLVIITIRDPNPAEWENLPSDHIIYDYDDGE